MKSSEVSTEWKIDELCARFESQLKAGRTPDIERELKSIQGSEREAALFELLVLELWYAKKRNALLAIDDYLLRFSSDKNIVQAAYQKVVDQPIKTPLAVKPPIDLNRLQLADTVTDQEEAGRSHSLSLPEQFGRYRILRRLGSGAMGNVYLARDEELSRQVALKIPRFLKEDSQELRSRFRREAQAAAGLSHPNLCPVYDIGEIEGIFFITMAYIEGQPLSEILQQGRLLKIRQAIRLVRTIAEALAEAHEKGIIHRDLKPSNIMIDERGKPIVVDFGLARTQLTDVARLTAPGAILGTPAYASPEQIEGHDEADCRTDIFSLGMILYELLTGRIPYDLSKPYTLLRQIVSEPPPVPSETNSGVSEELDAICLKALAKSANDRFQSMRELEHALGECEANTPDQNNGKPDWFRPLAGRDAQSTKKQSSSTVSNAGQGKVPSSSGHQAIREKVAILKEQARLHLNSVLPMVKGGLIVVVAMGLVWAGMQLQALVNPVEDVTEANHPKEGSNNGNTSITIFNGPAQEADENINEIDQVAENDRDKDHKATNDDDQQNMNAELPELRVQLPIPVGGWTFLRGSMTLAERERMDFSIRMRAVENRKIEDRDFQVVEFDVETSNSDYQEQASLLIDVNEYQEFHKLVVHTGWVFAPKENVLAKFDAEIDEVAHAFRLQGLETLPDQRLSVHDVLALLFRVDLKTSNPFISSAHTILHNERLLKNQQLKITPPDKKSGKSWLIRTVDNSDGSPVPVRYSPIEICLDSTQVPFNWKQSTIQFRRPGQLAFDATMERLNGNSKGAVAEFSPPEWSPEKANPIDYKEYAYLTIPETEGAWCSYEVNLRVPQLTKNTLKVDRVEVKVLNSEVVDKKRCRWIEVRSQIGGDFSPKRIVESVKLLIDEELYQEQRTFHVLKAGQMIQIGNGDAMYARFDVATDRMHDYYSNQLPPNRLPIRNVLSLMFGAELEPHFLDFSIRRHISFALIDGRFRRHFIENRHLQMSANKGDDDIACTLVRPGRSVSIVKKGDLPPTTLDYKIFVTPDDKTFPFRWVKLDVDLFGRDVSVPDPRIFGGYLVLREFGKNAKTEMANLEEIWWNDPEEIEHRNKAAAKIRNAEKFKDMGNREDAIKWYELARDVNPDTLTAKSYQDEIDKLK